MKSQLPQAPSSTIQCYADLWPASIKQDVTAQRLLGLTAEVQGVAPRPAVDCGLAYCKEPLSSSFFRGSSPLYF